jgi:hypothetical protein
MAAEYYDKLMHGLETGLDEDASTHIALQQVARTSLLQSQSEDRGKSKFLLKLATLQLRAAETIENYKTRAKSPRRVEVIAANLDIPIVSHDADVDDVVKSATRVQGSVDALKKLVQKMNRASTMTDSPLQHGIPDFQDETGEFRKIRQEHYKICLLMSEFDHITEAIMDDREREVGTTYLS